MTYYIRFKDIPANEISGIYDGDLGRIGDEPGVSCWETIEINGEYRIILPSLDHGLCSDLGWMIDYFIDGDYPCYLIEGDLVGTGTYNEPTLKNIKIIHELEPIQLHDPAPAFKMDRTNVQFKIKDKNDVIGTKPVVFDEHLTVMTHKSNEDPAYLGIPNINFSLTLDETGDIAEKHAKQRMERGFDDSETWMLYITIAKFILPRLKVLSDKMNGNSCPLEYTEDWQKALGMMIIAFRHIADIDYSLDNKEAIEEGLDIFRRYFFDLWVEK